MKFTNRFILFAASALAASVMYGSETSEDQNGVSESARLVGQAAMLDPRPAVREGLLKFYRVVTNSPNASVELDPSVTVELSHLTPKQQAAVLLTRAIQPEKDPGLKDILYQLANLMKDQKSPATPDVTTLDERDRYTKEGQDTNQALSLELNQFDRYLEKQETLNDLDSKLANVLDQLEKQKQELDTQTNKPKSKMLKPLYEEKRKDAPSRDELL